MLKTMRKRKNIMFFLMTFSILFVGLVISGPALADGDDDGDGISNIHEDGLSRKIKAVLEDDKVMIESELKTEEYKDKYKAEIEGEDEDEGLKIKYEYKSRAHSEKIDIKLEVRFTQIVEWIDTDEDGFNETDIIQLYPLEDFTYTLNDAQSDTGEKLYELTATSGDEVFKVRVLAPENFTLIAGQQVEPTLLKFDIEIHNFPYEDAEGDSQLALETRAKVKTSANISYIKDSENKLLGLNATIGNYTVKFTWVDDISVDGVPEAGTVDAFINKTKTKVMGKSGVEQVELKMYLLYPRGNDIIHDPQIGTPLKSLTYAQDIQVALPRSVVPEKLKGIIPRISIGNYFFGSVMATLLVISVSVVSRRRKR